MEARDGNPKKARELFQQGSERCKPHAPLLNAWAHFEASMLAQPRNEPTLIVVQGPTVSGVASCACCAQPDLRFHVLHEPAQDEPLLFQCRQAKQRRVAVARRLWNQALDLAPHNIYALTGLAALEARSDNHERALG